VSGPLFHHARELAHVRPGPVTSTPLSRRLEEPDCPPGGCSGADAFHMAIRFDAAYAWIAERLGFWPLFVAVGESDEDRRMTGYQDQWRRGASARASMALFSWREPPPGAVFMDFTAWHIVLNRVEFAPGDPHRPRVLALEPHEERQVWKRSWRASDWIRMARRGRTSVQAVVPALDLAGADEVWTRNRAERARLIRLGFDPSRIVARRLRVG